MPEYLTVPAHKLPGMVGKHVHLSWAIRGCHWTLVGILGDEVLLTTNRGKSLRAKAADVQYVNRSKEGRKARRDHDHETPSLLRP